MINNDILRAVRYMLDLSDPKVVGTVRRAGADFPIENAEAQALTRKEAEPVFLQCGDSTLARFLDGLIVHLRGRDDSRPPRPVETRITNNLVLKKLRVAFELEDVTCTRSSNRSVSSSASSSSTPCSATPRIRTTALAATGCCATSCAD